MEKESTITVAILVLGSVMLLAGMSGSSNLPDSFCLFSGLMACLYGLWSLPKLANITRLFK
jgi:hypothetical protein